MIEHEMKVLERVVDKRLRDIVDIDGMQFGFMKGKGTTDAIRIVMQIQDKLLERKHNQCCAFGELEKQLTEYPENDNLVPKE